MRGATDDRILYWPVILSVLCPIVFILAWSGPFSLRMLLVPPMVLILWMACSVFAVVTAIAWAYQRAWRRLLSTLILPVSVVLAGLNLSFVWRTGQRAGDYVHLLVMYPHYMAAISALPAEKRKFVVFDWGGFVEGYGVVYDESDEIASNHPSEGWKELAKRSGVIGFGYPRAIDHFYFVDLH